MIYHDYPYLDMLSHIMTQGVPSEDRTGTGTKKVWVCALRFDLQEGFPLLTTKKVNFKAVVNELLWMIGQGSTDVKWLQDRGHSFWNSWVLEDGTIGKGYGYQFRRVEKVRIGQLKTPIENKLFQRVFDVVEPDYTHDKYLLVGTRHDSLNYGPFTVIKEIPPENHPGGGQPTKFEIQFDETGYQVVLQNKQQLLDSQIRDPWYPRVCGVGFLGNHDNDDPHHESLYKTWSHMLSRCYDKTDPAWGQYGNKDIKVCDRWLCYAHFQEDVKKLHNWDMKLENWSGYSLDKDILGGNGYSSERCIWASVEEQSRNRSNIKLLEAQHEDGRKLIRFGFKGIERATGVHASNLQKTLTGERESAGGWTVSRVDTGDQFASVMIIDQMAQALATLKHNPNSRRIVVDLWNPGDLMETPLPPCHMMHQFQVMNGKLNMCIYQRSVDTFLGLPWNIAFYALLTHIMASMAGLEVGELVWVGADVHIYNNCLKQVEEQLSRQPRQSPTLTIKDVKNPPKTFEDWDFIDFTLTDYNPHPSIKAKVSV